MRKVRSAVITAAAALLLSGCGIINAFIPDQEVDNVFGLSGAEVTLQAADAAASDMAMTQAASATYSASVTGSTFPDVDTSGVPAGIRPSAVEEALAIEGSIDVTFAGGVTPPSSLTIVGAALELTLDDGSSEPIVGEFASGTLSFTLTEAGCGALQTCTYEADTELLELMQLAMSGPEFDSVWALITNGDESNTASGTFTVTFGSAISAQAIQVTIRTSNGKIKFG